MDEMPSERLSAELSLLQSMFPSQIVYEPRSRELTYNNKNAALTLRLPDAYLHDALPEVIVAVTATKVDLRNRVKTRIQEECSAGEEVLDVIVLAFDDLVEASTETDARKTAEIDVVQQQSRRTTIVVWLHHLLNTSKRKQALSPLCANISGVTKPGYPGVLVYSGPEDSVRQHVNNLRQLNWQAFQVRLECNEEWPFVHGAGVIEVEAMKDIVAEIDESRKQAFLEAMKIK